MIKISDLSDNNKNKVNSLFKEMSDKKEQNELHLDINTDKREALNNDGFIPEMIILEWNPKKKKIAVFPSKQIEEEQFQAYRLGYIYKDEIDMEEKELDIILNHCERR